MDGRILFSLKARPVALRLLMGAALLGLPAQSVFGVSCPVVKHNPPSEAAKALLAADFAKAESLYRADLTKTPGDAESVEGLVHALLGQQKTQEAADAVKAALAAAPNSAPLLTLSGEVQFRQGEPWAVEPVVLASYKLDPCNPRTRLLYARFAMVNSRYATARQQLGLAHQFDPEDAEIRAAWIQTLPLDQRIKETEAALAAPEQPGTAAATQMRADLERWKKQAAEPLRACLLVSKTPPVDIPFIDLKGFSGPYGANSHRAYGLDVALNGNSTRLQLGAGEGGLTLYRPAAERAGLKRITASEPGGPMGKSTYTAGADSIKIGNMEFQNCTVKVVDGSGPFDDGDGTIGMDVFSDSLVTLDYPMHKVKLGPLPLRTGETAAPALRLRTTSDAVDAADASAADRFIAPEMKDYTQIYRVGDSLILPAALNAAKVKLFVLDLGADATSVAPAVAREVSKVSEKMIFGQKALVADEITFNFAHLSQKVNGVVAVDTSMATRGTGMEISGSIGANTFSVLIMHIDYRDGLVKFEYIPNRGYSHQ